MQKKKSGVKKCLEILPLKGGGVGRLMANAILNFHFDFPHPSLISGLSGEVFEKIGLYTHRVCWKIPWHWNLDTGNVSNGDTLGVQKGKAGKITHIMTVTKN